MQQGFSDIGYLLAPQVRSFRPAIISRRVWRQRVRVLAEQVESRNHPGVRRWFHAHYPLLMTLIPRRRHREFAQGVIERATEQASGNAERSEG